MPTVMFGNTSVIEKVKRDQGLDDSPDNVDVVSRKDLGKRVTTMALNERDGDGNPSLELNLAHAKRFWDGESDKPPAWVDCPDSELLGLALADHYGCRTGRPGNWKEG